MSDIEGQEGGGTGEGGAKWSDSLPEGVRDWKEVQDSADADAFYKTMGDMRSRLGNSITVPTNEATPEVLAEFAARLGEKVPGVMLRPDADNAEAMNAFYNSLGRPEKAGGYKMEEIGGLDQGFLDKYKEVAHAAGISQNQFEKMVGGFRDMVGADADARQDAHSQKMEALKSEYGGGYDRHLNMAVKYAEVTGAPAGLVEAIKDGSAGADTIKWLMKTANSIGSEKINLADEEQGGTGGLTPEEAESQIADIMRNPAYFDGDHPDHARLVKKAAELTKLKNKAA